MRYVILGMVFLLTSVTAHAGVVYDVSTLTDLIQQKILMAANEKLSQNMNDLKQKTNEVEGTPSETPSQVERSKTMGKGDDHNMYTNCANIKKLLAQDTIETPKLFEAVQDCYVLKGETFYNNSSSSMNSQVAVKSSSQLDEFEEVVVIDVNKDASVKNSIESLQQQAHVIAEAARALATKTHQDIRENQNKEFEAAKEQLKNAKTIDALKKVATNFAQKSALEIHRDGVIMSNRLAMKSIKKLQGFRYNVKSSKGLGL